MSTKNYGPLVSGYLLTDNRAWESVVIQAGKPILDKELNLGQDLDIGSGQLAAKTGMPSGWIVKDFLSKANPITGVFLSGIAETLSLESQAIHVNGWIIQVASTNNVAGGLLNSITLPTYPVGAGVRRFDLVILEVWRRLISASPSADGKSALSRIWRYGNVKIDAAQDAALNYSDDLLDTNVGAETTKRVQIQYRLRVIENVDLLAYHFGINDPTVVARSVPVGPGLPDGNVTVFGYTNQSANGDPGLWVAGNGNPANTLGTVDGYMYAIPMLAVVRRNSTAFDKNTNHNGAGVTPGASGRPDNLYADVIVVNDIIDLRQGINLNGWDYAEVLEKNFNRVLDNSLTTEWGTTPQGGGCDGTTYLWADEIGIKSGHGGDGVTTGDTPGAVSIGEFDATRRAFSDRSVFEVMTVKVDPPIGGWVDGATVTINPTSLAIYPYTAFNWAAYNDGTVMFLDVLGARWIGPPGMIPARLNFTAMSRLKTVEGLGVQTIVPLTITFGNTVTALGLTDEPLYVDILVGYPSGLGLTKTPLEYHGTYINNPAQMPAIAPVSYNSFALTNGIDAPHREIQIQYDTGVVLFSFVADNEIALNSSFVLPERADFVTSVNRNGVPIAGTVSLDASGRVVTLNSPLDATGPGDEMVVGYVALRPMPQNDEQVTVYYRAAAPQAAREVFLGTSLSVIPRYISPRMYVITTGSGSQDEGYPFPLAYNQTGGIFPPSITGEHELSARADISITDFGADTGFLELPVFVGYVPNPDAVMFGRSVGDIDGEGRSFFKTVPGGAYIPNAYAQNLSDAKRHKVILPMLAELSADSTLGFKGQLVMVLLIRWASFDAENGVWFDANLTTNTTTASVFRIQGNLLNGKF